MSQLLIEIGAERCKRSLYEFVRQSFHIVETDEFVDGKHIQLICKALENCYRGNIRNLKINIPFRHMKSLLVNVFFPAWVWANNPKKKFLFTSYGDDLILRDSLKCKKLIESEWYQERFGLKLSKTRNTSYYYENVHGGFRQSITFGGGITGEGADYVCVDDPLKAADANSDAKRKKANDDYDDAISNRVSPNGCRIIIMQRLHEADLCGHLDANKALEYESIILPAEYDGERYDSQFPELNDWRSEIGELLWPERFDHNWITETKAHLSEKGVEGQLQQRPIPLTGGTFKRIWFEPRYTGDVKVFQTWISADTASSLSKEAAYSTILVADLLIDYRLVIRKLYRDKWEFPQLVSNIEKVARENQATLGGVLVENKSSGVQALQTLSQFGEDWLRSKLVGFNPKKGKEERAIDSSLYCLQGSVLLPPVSVELEWLPDFEEEVFTFPSSATKDIVDSLSQLIWHLRLYLADGARARLGLRSLMS